MERLRVHTVQHAQKLDILSNTHFGVANALAGGVGDVEQAAEFGAVDADKDAKVLDAPHRAPHQRVQPACSACEVGDSIDSHKAQKVDG